MSGSWILRLTEPFAEGGRIIGGLPISLRLALDAQRAGARCISAPEALAPDLVDERLSIPVVPPDEAPSAPSLSVPANLIAHRDALAVAARGLGPGEQRRVDPSTARVGGMYGFAPIAVTDGPTARAAEAALLRSLRKPQDGWTARWLNRHVSLAITRWLVRTPLRPNQVSVAILGVGLLGAWLASRGTHTTQVAGALLFQSQSILDGCDGEMSRLTHRGSLAGEWLDTIGDDLTNYGFFAGAGWGLYVQTHQVIYLIAGAVTVAAGLVGSGLEYRYLAKIGSGDLLRHPASQTGSSGGALAKIAPLFKRDTFVLLTLLAALLDQLGPMLVVFALGALGVLANVVSVELKMARSEP